MHEALYHIRVLQLMCEKEQLNLVFEEASEFSFRASGESPYHTYVLQHHHGKISYKLEPS